MLASTIDINIIPFTWRSAVLQIQQKAKTYIIPVSGFLDRITYTAGNATTMQQYNSVRNSIDSLGWSAADVLETYFRLRTFAKDWDSPDMEGYDEL
jgi:hypothetical protein